jgi:hypothetical protein
VLDALMKPAEDGDERSPGQRRADALVQLARGALHGAGVPLPAVGGQRPHLGVLVTAETLAAATDTAPATPFDDPATVGRRDPDRYDLPALAAEPGWTPWAGALAGPTLRRLACDSVLWRVVLDPTNGLPLDLGRQHRVVPGWLRRALYARDCGCRFPGCDAPADWCDGHHLRSWLDGGDTAITNLILLCRYHHVRIHEHGWKITVHPATGDVTATRPNGRPYEIRRSPPHTSTWHHPDPNPDRNTASNPDYDVGYNGDAA